jgi:RNA polymerase subunit RPABC4/transcription elongation factor Spt4
MPRRACRDCKRIIAKGTACVVCKTSNTTTNFQGTIVIFDPESAVAKKLGITAAGTYAIKI